MKHVGERLGVHQPVFDGDVQQCGLRLVETAVQGFSNPLVVTTQFLESWPVSWLVRGKAASDRIDAKGEQLVEFRMERLEPQNSLSQEVPIERLQVPKIEDDPMSFRNGPFVE